MFLAIDNEPRFVIFASNFSDVTFKRLKKGGFNTKHESYKKFTSYEDAKKWIESSIKASGHDYDLSFQTVYID